MQTRLENQPAVEERPIGRAAPTCRIARRDRSRRSAWPKIGFRIAFCFATLAGMDIIQRMTWEDLAASHWATAQCLRDSKDPRYARGVCGRAYYAAYALVTARLPDDITFGRGWRNPEHARLPGYVAQIRGLRQLDRQAIRKALRRLRQRREDADYRPGITVDGHSSRESMRDAAEVFRLLSGRNS